MLVRAPEFELLIFVCVRTVVLDTWLAAYFLNRTPKLGLRLSAKRRCLPHLSFQDKQPLKKKESLTHCPETQARVTHHQMLGII
jgi:hypothetical protein